MLKALKTLLAETSEKLTSAQSLPNTLRRSLPENDQQLLASAAAMLLFEVAWADHDMSEQEIALIQASLTGLFELPEALVEDIVADARLNHENSVGVYEYTRTINEALEPEDKFELMVALWRLAQSDEQLDVLEEHAIRRISELLYVPHAQFIRAKQSARKSTSGE